MPISRKPVLEALIWLDADLRGADLHEVDLNGAYLVGTKLDGEVVKTKPYEEEVLSGTEGKTPSDDSVKSEKKSENQGAAVSDKIDVGENKTAAQKKPETDGHASDKKDMNNTASMEKSGTDGVAVPESQVKENVVRDTTANAVPKETGVKEAKPLPDDHEPAISSAQDGKSQNVEQEKTRNIEPSSASVPAQEKSVVEKDPVIAKQTEKGKNTAADRVQPAEISSDKAKNLKQLLETKKCYQCDLAGIDLSGKDLGKADLEGADLKGSNLEKADLAKANLRGASLVNANLKKADLKEADLYKANLSGADLTDAAMENAKVDETLFVGAIGRNM